MYNVMFTRKEEGKQTLLWHSASRQAEDEGCQSKEEKFSRWFANYGLILDIIEEKEHTFIPSNIIDVLLNGSVHSSNHLMCNRKQEV